MAFNEKKMKKYLTIPYIRERFEHFNCLCFEGKLPTPPIRLGRSRRVLGCVSYKQRRGADGKKETFDYVLRISACFNLKKCDMDDVILHEMIHYYILVNGIQDTSKHGQVFRKMMNDINRQHGTHITISHRSTKEELPEEKEHPAMICLTQMKNGDTGITVCARTRIFHIYRELPLRFDIEKMTWYYVEDPFFRRYPRSIKAKVYRVDMNELKPYLKNAVEMECDGRRMKRKTSG